MSVQKFLHAAIVVTDLEKSNDFYGKILGLKTQERNLNFPGIWYQIGDVQIHLIATDSPVLDHVELAKSGRHRHLAFSVTNLEEIKQTLIDHHYPIKMSSSGRLALFTEDPDGNIIELAE